MIKWRLESLKSHRYPCLCCSCIEKGNSSFVNQSVILMRKLEIDRCFFLHLLIAGLVDLGGEEVALLESRAGYDCAWRNPSTKTHYQNAYATHEVKRGYKKLGQNWHSSSSDCWRPSFIRNLCIPCIRCSNQLYR